MGLDADCYVYGALTKGSANVLVHRVLEFAMLQNSSIKDACMMLVAVIVHWPIAFTQTPETPFKLHTF